MKNRLKEYREKAKLSQDELSEKASVSRATISALESGKEINVQLSTLQRLADVLKRKVSTVFNI